MELGSFGGECSISNDINDPQKHARKDSDDGV
jgi:hypothetical protein